MKKIRAIQKQDLIQVAEKWLTQSNYIDVALSSEEMLRTLKNWTLGLHFIRYRKFHKF